MRCRLQRVISRHGDPAGERTLALRDALMDRRSRESPSLAPPLSCPCHGALFGNSCVLHHKNELQFEDVSNQFALAKLRKSTNTCARNKVIDYLVPFMIPNVTAPIPGSMVPRASNHHTPRHGDDCLHLVGFDAWGSAVSSGRGARPLQRTRGN